MTFTERVAAYFQDRPHQWISAEALIQIGGRYAWRTRVSDCRKGGMVIRNRVRSIAKGVKVSEYLYVPVDDRAALAADVRAGSSVSES